MRGPFATFNLTLDRCYGLTDHYRRQLKLGRPAQPLADVLRGTIVLATAALDAFNVALLVRALPRAQRGGLLVTAAPTKKISRELLKDLRTAAGPPLGDRVRSRLRWMTLQRPDAIEEMFVNVLGTNRPWDETASELRRLTPRSWTGSEVRAALDTLVERRDRIVHHADASQKGTGTRSIGIGTVEPQLLVVLEVGRALRKVVEDRV